GARATPNDARRIWTCLSPSSRWLCLQDPAFRLHVRRLLIRHVPERLHFIGGGSAGAGYADPRNPTGDLWGTRSFHERMLQLHQFNLGLEKEFAGNTTRVIYVGSLGRHSARFFSDYNTPP